MHSRVLGEKNLNAPFTPERVVELLVKKAILSQGRFFFYFLKFKLPRAPGRLNP